MACNVDGFNDVVTRLCIKQDDNVAQMLALVANHCANLALHVEQLEQRFEKAVDRIRVLEGRRRVKGGV